MMHREATAVLYHALPFYQQWWFWLAAVGFLVFLFFVIRYCRKNEFDSICFIFSALSFISLVFVGISVEGSFNARDTLKDPDPAGAVSRSMNVQSMSNVTPNLNSFGNFDFTDPTKNSIHADSMLIDGQQHKDCTAVFSDVQKPALHGLMRTGDVTAHVDLRCDS